MKGVQGNCVPDLTVARGLLCLPPLVRMLRSRKKPFPLSLLVQFLQHERPYCTRVMYTNIAGRKPAHVRLLPIELLFPVGLSHPFPGPSGMDAAGRRLMCTAFHEASRDLFISLTAFTCHISSNFIDPSGLAAFIACRLIPLDKKPGERPIGISETV